MVTNETVSKLQDMHLSTMARRFKEQLDNPQMKELSFEDRFGLLVDAEWTTRKNNHLARLIKKAGYAIPGACMEDIEYLPERKLDKAQLTRLTSCSYIQESHNIVLLGATGAGKTYIACALSMAASRKKFKKIKLLILDEWLLYPLKESEARDVLELVEARTKTASTIFCSQMDVPGWHENLYDPTLADAICDRIVHDSYVIQIHGESMRKRKGLME